MIKRPVTGIMTHCKLTRRVSHCKYRLRPLKQPRSQGLFPGLGAGREKALGSAGHMISEHPKILGVLNYHMLKRTFQDGGPVE